MQRTTIMLPRELKMRAANQSRKMGVSLGQLIREALQREVASTEKSNGLQDCFYADKAVYQGDSPPDLCAEHDEYLYGESHDIR
jgi:predicted DNA-binding protein